MTAKGRLLPFHPTGHRLHQPALYNQTLIDRYGSSTDFLLLLTS